MITLTRTLFLWQSIAMTAVLIAGGGGLSIRAVREKTPRTAADYSIEFRPIAGTMEARTKPGEWLEHSPGLNIPVAAWLGWCLIDVFRTSPQGALAALDLNTCNLIFLTVELARRSSRRCGNGAFCAGFQAPGDLR